MVNPEMLRAMMSTLSLRCFKEAWHDRTEYRLWYVLTGAIDAGSFGTGLTTQEVDDLRTMQEALGGWVTEDGTFVPTAEWAKLADQ